MNLGLIHHRRDPDIGVTEWIVDGFALAVCGRGAAMILVINPPIHPIAQAPLKPSLGRQRCGQ